MSVKTETQKIEFTGTLNMNKNQTDIKQFAGFNTKNSPVFGGCLSPFYTKSVTKSGIYQITRNGDIYRAYNGNLYKNGSAILSYDQTYFKKEEYTFPELVTSDPSKPKTMIASSCVPSTGKIFTLVEYDTGIQVCYDSSVVYDTGSLTIQKIYAAAINYYTDSSSIAHFQAAVTCTIGNLNKIVYINYNLSTASTTTITATSSTNTLYGLHDYYVALHNDSNGVPVISTATQTGQHLNNVDYQIYNDSTKIKKFINQNYIVSDSVITAKTVKTYAETTDTGYYMLNVMLEDGTWCDAGITSSTPHYSDSDEWSVLSLKWYFNSSSFTYDSTADAIIVYANTNYYTLANSVTDGTDWTAGYKTFDLYQFFTHSTRLTPVIDVSIVHNSNELGLRFGSGHVLDSSTFSPTMYNNTGSIVQLYESDEATLSPFRILMNNGVVSGLSYGNNGYYGILLTDWNTVDYLFHPVAGSDFIIYKNESDNKYYKISISSTNDINLLYILDRYIIINSTTFRNCYDTKTGKIFCYSSDFNANVYLGLIDYIVADGGSVTGVSDAVIYAQGINCNYELSDNTITSIQINPMVLLKAYASPNNKITRFVDNDNSYIDIYINKSSTATSATYLNSIQQHGETYAFDYVNQNLIDAIFPTTTSGNIIYNPSIFTEYIKSYVNQDMAITDGTAYPIIYTDSSIPVPAFYLLSGMYNLTGVFVIQGQIYGLSDTKIFSLTFSDGTLTNATAIVDISSYTYISANPRMAIFWSMLNKSVYVFTGDRLLTRLYEANKITTIYGSYYNPANYAIYISTDAGLYVITDDNIYCIDQTDISNMFFCEDSFIIESSTNLIYYKYVTGTGYVSEGIKLATAYYGMGNNGVSVIDTWYIRLYNNGTAESGTLKVSVNSLTDIGRESETKIFTIKATDWDSETGTFYIRYQPKYQRGIGLQLSLETDFPIADMSCSVSSGGELQVAHNNI